MFRRVVALLALPVAGLFAQGPVRVSISVANNARYRITQAPGDSSRAPSNVPVIGQGTAQFTAPTLGAVTIAAVDSVSPVHVEVSENGRLIASGDGRFITVRSDSGFVSLRVHVSNPLSPSDRKP